MPNDLEQQAYNMLKSNQTYETDARVGAPVGNTIVGSVLSLTSKSPRQYTEQAVRQALLRIDRENRTKTNNAI